MTKSIILLLVISAGISAYLKARQDAMWSWSSFAKTVLCLLVIGGTIGFLGVWIGRLLGPECALVTTIGIVAGIVVGVAVLTVWMRGKKGRSRG
jgi:hypothetical protein